MFNSLFFYYLQVQYLIPLVRVCPGDDGVNLMGLHPPDTRYSGFADVFYLPSGGERNK